MRQIVEYVNDNGGHIDLFVLEHDPEAHMAALLTLIDEKATILTVDSDTIRARVEPADQERLKELLADGWQFSGREETV